MKYEWNPAKNEWLKEHRNVSFEQVIFHLSQGDVWKIAAHPNQDKYPGQKIYFVIVENYIYLIPHIIERDYIFLKTIIPSRKATRDYQSEKEMQSCNMTMKNKKL
ncbi:MAG TPA: toxin [Thermodesulfovibrionia bacterium]|nr:toxin [Thermodesulfovibrionia bacterium]